MMLLRGDTDGAAALFAEAAEIADAIGDKRHTCFALGAREIGMKLVIVETLFCFAGIAGATGDAPRAARLAAAAELRGSLLSALPTLSDAGFHQRHIESAKAACALESWEEAWTEGKAMSLDEAAEYALSAA